MSKEVELREKMKRRGKNRRGSRKASSLTRSLPPSCL